MTRDNFTPGMHVRAHSWGDESRREFGVGTVVEPEPLPRDPLQTTGLVLVAMPEHDGYRAMSWWYRPEQLEPVS